MGHSSLVGTDKAPLHAKGTDEQALGPSDSTDSGSDMQGADSLPAADPGEPVDVTLNRDQAVAPVEGTSEDSTETDASDIDTDRVIDAMNDVESLDGAAEGDDALPAAHRRGKQPKPS